MYDEAKVELNEFSDKENDLYVNNVILYPLFCREIRKIEETGNWLIKGYQPTLKMEYAFYYGVNDQNQKLVDKLYPGCKMIVTGTLKCNRAGNLILRAKQVVVNE